MSAPLLRLSQAVVLTAVLCVVGCVGFALGHGAERRLPFVLVPDTPHIIYHVPVGVPLTMAEQAAVSARARRYCPPGWSWQVWVDKRSSDVFIVYLGEGVP